MTIPARLWRLLRMNRTGCALFALPLVLALLLALGLRGCAHRHRHRTRTRTRFQGGHVLAVTPAPTIPARRPLLATPAPPAAPPISRVPRDALGQAVYAIAAQSDPAKLVTLGSRGANPRLKRIVFYLAQARDAGADPARVIEDAQKANGSAGTPRAALVKSSLLRNLKIADGLGLLTASNRAALRHGAAPVVTRGPYAGQRAEVDHIVPRSLARDLDHELANLEMLPARLNRQKGARVGERQLDYARRFQAAGLLPAGSFARVQAAYRPAGTARMELALP